MDTAMPSRRVRRSHRYGSLAPLLVFIAVVGALLGLGCGDKEAECEDLEHEPCELVGLSDGYQGYCDACEVLWTCLYGSVPEAEEPGYFLFSSDFPAHASRTTATSIQAPTRTRLVTASRRRCTRERIDELDSWRRLDGGPWRRP